jgi:murein L,D-transpeptidase YcbB/YkuD
MALSTARRTLLLSFVSAGLVLAPTPFDVASAQSGQAVERAIKSTTDSRELRSFYKARGYRPLWIEDGHVLPAAGALVELIASVEADGLDPERYRPRRLVEALDSAQGGSSRALARAEALLSDTFVALVRDMRRPTDIGMVYVDKELAPAAPGASAALKAAAAAPSLENYVQRLGWMHPIYAQLRRGLGDYHYSWGGGGGIDVPAGPPIKPGATGERVRALQQRLGLDPTGEYDADVANALRGFQSAHGLPSDGVAGPRTIAALNEDGGSREDVIRLNLERARSLPADPRQRHVIVDAASARLWMYEDGRVVDSMKVVVGKPSEQTPMMAGFIRYASVNPYWNLPPDLARKRVAEPALKKGPSFVRANRFEVLSDFTPNAKPLDPKSVDWAEVASGRKELPIRKLPGKDNAMGKMKFMLPNDLGIYLHDTPERELFAKEERRFSSGCVRVEDAQRLAKWLFGRPLVVKTDTPEQQVNLPQPVPVFITYLTASPTEKGIAFRRDPYNRDAGQMARLGVSRTRMAELE